MALYLVQAAMTDRTATPEARKRARQVMQDLRGDDPADGDSAWGDIIALALDDCAATRFKAGVEWMREQAAQAVQVQADIAPPGYAEQTAFKTAIDAIRALDANRPEAARHHKHHEYAPAVVEAVAKGMFESTPGHADSMGKSRWEYEWISPQSKESYRSMARAAICAYLATLRGE